VQVEAVRFAIGALSRQPFVLLPREWAVQPEAAAEQSSKATASKRAAQQGPAASSTESQGPLRRGGQAIWQDRGAERELAFARSIRYMGEVTREWQCTPGEGSGPPAASHHRFAGELVATHPVVVHKHTALQFSVPTVLRELDT